MRLDRGYRFGACVAGLVADSWHWHRGAEAQFLPKMATGEWLGCFALTEPQAGSDAAGQKTRAVRDGDSYVINGTKNFITNGPEAGIAIVFAMTDADKGNHGISAFIVETSPRRDLR